MSQYLLLAGNTPALTFYEAKIMLGQSVEQLDEQVAAFEASSDEEATKLFSLLGASVKLARVEKPWQTYSEKKLEQSLLGLLTSRAVGKLRFSVAQWGESQNERLSLQNLKNKLAEADIKARFIEGARTGLSAAVLLHQNVTELIVFQKEKQILIASTAAVQDIDHWTLKDRGKSYADRKKGLLTPKVARTMVNLALGQILDPQALVYDPFCGSGTILMEALERGAKVVGSDLDPDAVLGSQTNLAWFADRLQLPTNFTIFQSEAAHASMAQLPGKVDAIVTEPFLGKPKPEVSQLEGMFKGLEKLYQGAFNQWRQLLKDKGKVVMILPRVEVPGGRTFDLAKFVDKLQAHGYTPQVELGQITYHRPQAIVQREIMVFEYSAK
jgi:tRNA G10  N-methylase Trm11